MIQRLFFGVFCLLSIKAHSITEAPTLLRACLDVNDSTVTILYRNPTDLCGSFVRYNVYGKESSGTFQWYSSQADFSATSVSFKIPNANPNWQFYFEALYDCSGSDSFQSNILILDTKRPANQEIDSVSVDLITQKFVIGWSANGESDVKGYRIYEYNKGSDISSAIGDTTSLAYNGTGKRANEVNWFTMSAFDSCNLFSAVSKEHRPLLLAGNHDPCNHSYSLNWSPYVGWNTLEHRVYKSLNGSPYTLEYSGINGTTAVLSTRPGDSICAFVRAYSDDGSKTSSSNVVCVKADTIALPRSVYLSYASLKDDDLIEIEVHIDNQPPTDSVCIYRQNGSGWEVVGGELLLPGAQSTSINYPTSDYSKPETFFARTFAPCVGQTDSSNIGRTIFLEHLDGNLMWTPYGDWDVGVDQYDIYGSDGNTWNYIASSAELSYNIENEGYTCFRVEAIESINRYKTSARSRSNDVCILKDPTFYVPNALNAAGENHTFRVIGTSLDFDRSTFQLFNRWGEVIYESKQIDVGWSINAEGRNIPTGIYFYTLSIVDLSGNKHKSSGSFRIIR